jgi:hypothetical protein
MREIRPSGSEGGVALTTPSLPLSHAEFAIPLRQMDYILAASYGDEPHEQITAN